MFSRIHFFSITLGVFAVLTATFLLPSTANAWTEIQEPAYTFDIGAKLDEQTASGTWASWSDWRTQNYAIFEYNNGGEPHAGSGTVIIGVWRDDQTGYGVFDGGTDATSVNFPFLCRWTFDGGYLYGCQNGGSMTANNLFGVKLNQAWIDAQNPTTWTPPNGYLGGGGSNPLDPENDNTPRCQPWDVVCWFSATVDSVVDGFQSLANFFGDTIKALGEWIANLIMPSNADGGFDNRFTGFFTTVQDTMTERLGFLLFPFEFIGDLVASLSTIYNPYGYSDAVYGNCTSGSQLAVPNLLGGHDVGFNLCGIEDTPIWQPAVLLLRFVWIVAVVGLLHKKYFSVVKA